MALKSTIFKAELNVSDLDRHYYGTHALTLARHPSETDERLMVRLLAFALYADEALSFGRGLSADDEPDLWRKDLTGAIDLWIDVGQPDEAEIRKAAGRSAQVVVITYGGRVAEIWWEGVQSKLARLTNLTVLRLPRDVTQAMADLAGRSMQVQVSLQDGSLWLTAGEQMLHIEPLRLQVPAGH